MMTAGPPDGSAASARAAENVVPSAEVSSILSAPAPPAMRGWRMRSAGRSSGWASKAKHTAALLGWTGGPRDPTAGRPTAPGSYTLPDVASLDDLLDPGAHGADRRAPGTVA